MGRNEKIFKMSLVIGGIVAVTLLHYLTRRQERYYHLFYRELYFFPLVMAGIWFGLRGAIYTSLCITLLFLPVVYSEWQRFSVGDFDQILSIFLFNIISIILGFISDREKTVLKNLQETETLAALGRTVSAIVHDMKTPLVAIGGYARSLKRKIQEDDPNQEKLDIIVKEAQRLDELTKDILIYARPVSVNRDRRDLNNLVRECCPIAEELAKQRKVKIETHLSPSLPPLNLDPAAIERVLLNLIVNAVQASPEEGVVTVETGREGREVVISIADDGPGISRKIREEIFSPFFTTKKEGTGLGLSIALKIIKAHGGDIMVTDQDGKGTVFKVTLPVGR
jgi:two-component system, NtrC family, sensor histidine kinase HydH